MQTGTDVAIELATVSAWLRAWESSDPEAKDSARAECVGVLMDVWSWLFRDRSIPPYKSGSAKELEKAVQALRKLLDSWNEHPENHDSIRSLAQKTLAQAINFFSTD